MWEVVTSLRANPNQQVRFVSGEDELCAHCPHNQGGCVSGDKVKRMDESVNLSGVLSFSEAVSRTNALDAENICKGCEWYSLCHII